MPFEQNIILEKTIERKLRESVMKKGGLCLKFVSPGFTGVMDRICLIPPGVVCFVETKRPGKDLSKRQAYVKRQFESLGMRVYKINSIEQINTFINEVYS